MREEWKGRPKKGQIRRKRHSEAVAEVKLEFVNCFRHFVIMCTGVWVGLLYSAHGVQRQDTYGACGD